MAFVTRAGFRILLLAAVVSAPLLSICPSRAADSDDNMKATEAAAVSDPAQQVIMEHLAAIGRRDAEQAYAMTTVKFHEKFRDPAGFLNKMRLEYRSLYNYDKVTFLDGNEEGDMKIQRVKVKDRYGDKPSIAIYRLERQPDGRWLIDSLTVLGGGEEASPI